MSNYNAQSGADPPAKKSYVRPTLGIYSSDGEWVLLGNIWYPVEELERDNPFNP